jgi:hypothetical protein
MWHFTDEELKDFVDEEEQMRHYTGEKLKGFGVDMDPT